MNTNFITVDKTILAKIVVLVDEAEKLSVALENNNQDARVLLHQLIKERTKQNKLRYRGNALAMLKLPPRSNKLISGGEEE